MNPSFQTPTKCLRRWTCLPWWLIKTSSGVFMKEKRFTSILHTWWSVRLTLILRALLWIEDAWEQWTFMLKEDRTRIQVKVGSFWSKLIHHYRQDIFQTSLLIPFSQSKYLVHDQFQFAFRGISGIADQINTWEALAKSNIFVHL